MLTIFSRFLIFFFLILIFFFSEKVESKEEYFECSEKITDVIKGGNDQIKIGVLIGTNYLKIDDDIITIKFKEINNNKIENQIQNQKMAFNSLGFEVYSIDSDNKKKIENTYNFIKLENTYAFTRKKFYWSIDIDENNYEYMSGGRCDQITKIKFNSNEKTEKNLKEEIYKKYKLKGERIFAINWEDVDDLMIGKIFFEEENSLGKLNFLLPDNKTKCYGTYVLSKLKGTWSILCEKKGMNASGFLKLSENGTVSGNGKDSSGKNVKFKISEQN